MQLQCGAMVERWGAMVNGWWQSMGKWAMWCGNGWRSRITFIFCKIKCMRNDLYRVRVCNLQKQCWCSWFIVRLVSCDISVSCWFNSRRWYNYFITLVRSGDSFLDLANLSQFWSEMVRNGRILLRLISNQIRSDLVRIWSENLALTLPFGVVKFLTGIWSDLTNSAQIWSDSVAYSKDLSGGWWKQVQLVKTGGGWWKWVAFSENGW